MCFDRLRDGVKTVGGTRMQKGQNDFASGGRDKRKGDGAVIERGLDDVFDDVDTDLAWKKIYEERRRRSGTGEERDEAFEKEHCGCHGVGMRAMLSLRSVLQLGMLLKLKT